MLDHHRDHMFKFLNSLVNQLRRNVLEAAYPFQNILFPLRVSLAKGMLTSGHEVVEYASQAENVDLLSPVCVFEFIICLV